ncbi:MAG: hypothetical protein DHS20C21_09310 [Gemmatimonadota bacterium]|nr:MAG: hypothetical protein DHS20C21_09310 [Gemmatimonadota bacterium]
MATAVTEGVREGGGGTAVERLEVAPNPTQDRVSVRWAARSSGRGTYTVYSVSGRILRAGMVDLAQQEVVWDGRDRSGVSVGPGVFFLRVEEDHGRVLGTVKVVRTQ